MKRLRGVWQLLLASIAVLWSARGYSDEPPVLAPLDGSSAERAPLTAPKAPVYQLRATLAADGASLRGEVSITFENTTAAPLSEALVMLYPNRFTERPAYLSELNQPAHYPGAFSPGAMRLTRVTVDGAPVSVSGYQEGPESEKLFAALPLVPALAPHQQATLGLAFEVEIPERFGRFGRAEGAVVLDGGFYPALAALGASRFATNRAPLPGRFSATLATEGVFTSFLNGAGPFLPGQAAVTSEMEAPYLSWILLPDPALRVAEDITPPRSDGLPREAAFDISYYYTDSLFSDLAAEAGNPWEVGPPGLDEAETRDYPSEVVRAAQEGLAFLRTLGFNVDELSVRLIQIPMREQLVRAAPGALLVSDRIMRISPSKRLLKFHKLQLLRAMYGAIVEERARAFEAEEDLYWVSDAVGAYLADLFHVKQYLNPSFAKEMLKPFSFISEVDRLRWTPQVGFKDAYFRSAYEADIFRDDVRRYPQRWPFGKFLYGKLRALLGVDTYAALVRDYLGGAQEPFRALSGRYYGKPLDWFYAQWMGPHPQINYRLMRFQSEAQPDGTYLHTVEVAKEGDTFVREPVEVLAVEEGGAQKLLLWPMDEITHTFTWSGARPLSRVKVDPQEDTYERIRGIADDLKFDNESPARWRVVFDGFTASASSNGLTFATSGSGRRQHDRRNLFFVGLSLASGLNLAVEEDGAARGLRVDDFAGLQFGYRYGFGFGLDADRLTGSLLGSAFGARLGTRILDTNGDAVFDSVTPPAVLGRLSASLGYSDRLSFLTPWKGRNAVVSLSYSLGVPQRTDLSGLSFGGEELQLLDTCAPTRGVCQSLSVFSNASRLFSLDGGRVLGVRANASLLFGNPLGQSLIDLGGDSGLKGYPLNVIEGRGRAFGTVEYRHPLLANLDVNLLDVNRLRSVTAVMWMDAATLAGREAIFGDSVRSLFGAGSVFADAGFGLRLIGDHLGIDPALLSFDVAFPLVGSQLTGGPFPAVQFYVGFDQNF